MSDPVTIRPYVPTDLEAVLELLRLALGETPTLRRTPSLFAWKHVDNPFGSSIMLVAESDGILAGFRALMRWELAAPDGLSLKCARAVDTATHPGFHRRGIFRSLTTDALEVAKAEGVELIFNTPNQRSGAGYLTMGWQEVGGIGVLVSPSWRAVTRRNSPRRQAGPPNLGDQSPVPAKLETLQRPPRGLRTPRREDYLDWRFRRHPTARYLTMGDPENQAVLRPNVRRGRRELVISDLFGDEPTRAAQVVRRHSRADYRIASFPPGTPERRAVMASGLVPVPWVPGPTLFVRPLLDLPLAVSAMSSWDLALSDVELL